MAVVDYKSYKERTVDTQYRDLLQRILAHGKRINKTALDDPAYRLINQNMTFDLTNGIPIINERDLSEQIKQGFAELFAFINGARTHEELKQFGCLFWKRFVTKEKCEKRGLKEGDLGLGSYGAAWHDFPMPNGETFDQWAHVIPQIKERPELRTHELTPWIPYYLFRHSGIQQKTVVDPCHGWLHIFANEDGTMEMHHRQRSADGPVGLVFNIANYALLLMMIAQVTGYKATVLHYNIVDAHIYESQIADVEKLLQYDPQPFADLYLDPSIKDIHDFRLKHVEIHNYNPSGPKMIIGTPR